MASAEGEAASRAFWQALLDEGADLRPPAAGAGSKQAKAQRDARKQCSRQARVRPVPDDLRRRLWWAATVGPHVPADSVVHEYQLAREACAAEQFPAGHARMFTCHVHIERNVARVGTEPDAGHEQRYLNVLQCLAWRHTEDGNALPAYIPWLPPIVAVSLRWLTEAEAFAVARAISPSSGAFDADSPVTPVMHSRMSSWLMLQTFERIASIKFSKLSYAALDYYRPKDHVLQRTSSKRGAAKAAVEFPAGSPRPFAGVVAHWAWSLKPGALPWVLDCFFLEGTKAFYRIGLVLLQHWEAVRQAGAAPASGGGSGGAGADTAAVDLAGLALTGTALDDFEAIAGRCGRESIPAAYAFKFSSSYIAKCHAKGADVARQAMQAAGRNLGVLEAAPGGGGAGSQAQAPPAMGMAPPFEPTTAATLLLGRAGMASLWLQAVPVRYQHRRPELVFTTDTHGYNLQRFYQHCGDHSPTLLLVRGIPVAPAGGTAAGAGVGASLAGAYLSHGWTDRHATRGYFGSGETCLIRCAQPAVPTATPATDDDGAGPQVDVYRWSEQESAAAHFMTGDDARIAVGGGGAGHGLELDKDFEYGTTAACDTFLNHPLMATTKFRCASVEVWRLDC